MEWSSAQRPQPWRRQERRSSRVVNLMFIAPFTRLSRGVDMQAARAQPHTATQVLASEFGAKVEWCPHLAQAPN